MAWFYRIEDASGEGPFRGETATSLWTRYNHCIENGCPPPRADFGIPWYEIEEAGLGLFGFSTLSQLQSWFLPEEILALHKLGCKIVRVKGEALLQSDRQVYFKPSEDQLWPRTSYPNSTQLSWLNKQSVVDELCLERNCSLEKES